MDKMYLFLPSREQGKLKLLPGFQTFFEFVMLIIIHLISFQIVQSNVVSVDIIL